MGIFFSFAFKLLEAGCVIPALYIHILPVHTDTGFVIFAS